VICLGHNGALCPGYGHTLEDVEDRALKHNNCQDKCPISDKDHTYGALPHCTSFGAGRFVTIVHPNGYHQVPVYPCLCASSSMGPAADGNPRVTIAEDIQFLAMGFYPASWRKISTVFTFELLKDFHLTKVEAKMSTENYCDILRRKTNFAFPDTAPVSRDF
jgi:hypothetical protein